jgi:hypothetical protein
VRSFLVVYNQSTGELLDLTEFGSDPGDRLQALRARQKAELDHEGEPEIEVVVLNAESQAALRRSHGRYFKSVHDLAVEASR